MTIDSVRIGAGAGFQGDRFEPAIILAEQGDLDYLVLECLAERTIAIAQKTKLDNPTLGFDPYLQRRIEPLLPLLKKRGIRLVTNMGTANPAAAGRAIIEIARQQGISIKVAVVSGDDVLARLTPDLRILETGDSLHTCANVISANAYLGIEAVLPALKSGADVIVTGRVADPSLFLAPIVHHFGWRLDDWQRLGRGVVIGHLLECAGQVTGGYFADPGKKDVPDLAHLGFPLAEVREDGSAILTKVVGTGGVINLTTVKEQLLYEVTDPAAYITPDVVADFTQVKLQQIGKDRVSVSNGLGRAHTDSYKVSIGYQAGFRGEGEISYAGQNALARAELAGRVIDERLREDFPDLRIDYIGSTSVHRKRFASHIEPYETRLRVAALAASAKQAARIGEEVEALYTNGPAGGGAARKYVTEVIGIVSVLLPRSEVSSKVTVLESEPHHETV